MIKSYSLIKAGCYLGTRWFVKKIVGRDRLPKSGSVIITPSHSSLVDGVILTSLINISRLSPTHTIVQKDPFAHPVFGYMLRSARCIPLSRTRKDSIVEMFKVALGYLGKGDVVMIFPEGHLNNGESLRLPRPGAALLALESGAPILPLGLRGTRDIHETGGKFHFHKRAEVHYGKLIDTTALSLQYHSSSKARRKELVDELSMRMMKQIAELSGLQLHRRMK